MERDRLPLAFVFIIRNVGNIIPPYGATNGGEGAAIEYAIQALDIRDLDTRLL